MTTVTYQNKTLTCVGQKNIALNPYGYMPRRYWRMQWIRAVSRLVKLLTLLIALLLFCFTQPFQTPELAQKILPVVLEGR